MRHHSSRQKLAREFFCLAASSRGELVLNWVERARRRIENEIYRNPVVERINWAQFRFNTHHDRRAAHGDYRDIAFRSSGNDNPQVWGRLLKQGAEFLSRIGIAAVGLKQ